MAAGKVLAELKVERARVDGKRRTVEVDLGPVRYLAALLGTDEESALRVQSQKKSLLDKIWAAMTNQLLREGGWVMAIPSGTMVMTQPVEGRHFWMYTVNGGHRQMCTRLRASGLMWCDDFDNGERTITVFGSDGKATGVQ